jgi:hypothetical protein
LFVVVVDPVYIPERKGERTDRQKTEGRGMAMASEELAARIDNLISVVEEGRLEERGQPLGQGPGRVPLQESAKTDDVLRFFVVRVTAFHDSYFVSEAAANKHLFETSVQQLDDEEHDPPTLMTFKKGQHANLSFVSSTTLDFQKLKRASSDVRTKIFDLIGTVSNTR